MNVCVSDVWVAWSLSRRKAAGDSCCGESAKRSVRPSWPYAPGSHASWLDAACWVEMSSSRLLRFVSLCSATDTRPWLERPEKWRTALSLSSLIEGPHTGRDNDRRPSGRTHVMTTLGLRVIYRNLRPRFSSWRCVRIKTQVLPCPSPGIRHGQGGPGVQLTDTRPYDAGN